MRGGQERLRPMRQLPVLIIVAIAALIAAASLPAAAWSDVAEARWCSVRGTGIAHVQWDCRYPTLAQCADAVGPRSDMCLGAGAKRNAPAGTGVLVACNNTCGFTADICATTFGKLTGCGRC